MDEEGLSEQTPLKNENQNQNTYKLKNLSLYTQCALFTVNIIYFTMSFIMMIVSAVKLNAKCCNNLQISVLMESICTMLMCIAVQYILAYRNSVYEHCVIIVLFILFGFCFTFLGIGLSLSYPYSKSIKTCDPTLFKLFFGYLNTWWILIVVLIILFMFFMIMRNRLTSN